MDQFLFKQPFVLRYTPSVLGEILCIFSYLELFFFFYQTKRFKFNPFKIYNF